VALDPRQGGWRAINSALGRTQADDRFDRHLETRKG